MSKRSAEGEESAREAAPKRIRATFAGDAGSPEASSRKGKDPALEPKRVRMTLPDDGASAASRRSSKSAKDVDAEEDTFGTGFDNMYEDSDDGEDDLLIGQDGYKDYSGPEYELKPDHWARPLWVGPDLHIFLETHSPYFKQAQDFLIQTAEPLNRPRLIHEYKITGPSLLAAVSMGLKTDNILRRLDLLSKTKIHPDVEGFVYACTTNFGKVKLVLRQNDFFLETKSVEVFEQLTENEVISGARILKDHGAGAGAGAVAARSGSDLSHGGRDGLLKLAVRQEATRGFGSGMVEAPLQELGFDEDLSAGDTEIGLPTYSIHLDPAKVQAVKQACLRPEVNLPVLEEYDFLNDKETPALDIDTKPSCVIWQHQEKGLSKMFSHGRARSGMIVLPCGAGKTLVGVAAAAHMRRSTLVLCTNAMAVSQWANQFTMWTTCKPKDVFQFTSQVSQGTNAKPTITNLVISTYSMICKHGKRSAPATHAMNQIQSREWGLIIMDEVHVFPTKIIRTLLDTVHAHCKLGLTATLVREDDHVKDLYFLVGPKLYEANWQDLVDGGFLARVECQEVWCPMTAQFQNEYLREATWVKRRALSIFNPNKFRACKALIEKHEALGHKTLVFCDDIAALLCYGDLLKRYYIHGGVSDADRKDMFQQFRRDDADPHRRTLILSSVGDDAIDLPEAAVIIQVTGLFGSRRQEAQRLGRILRRKLARLDGGANAWFYSLVSQDTQDMFWTTKRQQFLVDQGYAFHVTTEVLTPEGHNCFDPGALSAQDITEIDVKLFEAALDRESNPGCASSSAAVAKRRQASMSMLSGAGDLEYKEQKKAPRAKVMRDFFGKK